MSRPTALTAVRNAVVLALLALAIAATIAQPRESFTTPAAQAQAMTVPPQAEQAVAKK